MSENQCPRCGGAVPPAALFCPFCGHSLSAAAPSGETAPDGVCAVCGATLMAGASECSVCGCPCGAPAPARSGVAAGSGGRPVAAGDAPPTEGAAAGVDGQRRVWLDWLAGIVVLALLGLLGYWLYDHFIYDKINPVYYDL